jgi:type VI secretion system secreted protein VgrG
MNETKVYRIELSIGGETIREFIQLSLIQSFSEHHRLEIHLPAFVFGDGNPNSFVDLKKLTKKFVGEKADFFLKEGVADASNNFKKEKELLFKGLTSSIQLQKIDAVNTVLMVTILSPTILLDTGEHTGSFTNMKLLDIVEQMTKPISGFMQSEVLPRYQSSIPYTTQYHEDNYHFIQRMADHYGEWCYYDGLKFVFGKSTGNGPKITELEYGSNLTQMEYELQLVPLTSKGSYYDYFTDVKYETKAADEEISGLQDYTQTVLAKSEKVFKSHTLDISFQGYEDAESMRKSVLLQKSESSSKLAICKGLSSSLELKIGGLVKIKDDIIENNRTLRTDDYGTFLVTSIRHFVDARGFYQNSFEAIPQDTGYPPVDYRVFQPKAESQPAKVIDTDDPKSMGRVQVQFYWQKGKETTPWIRVASLMGGDKSGVYFTPEKDEVVFVDFEFGNPDLPFVRGSMYHGNVKPGNKLFEANNNFKGIITRGGNHIIIDDTSGKEEIRIYNKENKNEVVLSVNGDPHISVKSKGKITLEAEEIVMKAKTISMKADKNWSAEGSEVKIEGNEVSVEGKSETCVKGNQLSLEGKAQALLKAPRVDIN